MSDLARLNEIVDATNTTDFRIVSFSNDVMRIIGSFDLGYYHTVEVDFHGVSFINLPTDFVEPQFRLAIPGERNDLRAVVGDESNLFCIEAEATEGSRRVTFHVAASGVVIREGMVYHFARADLKDGERIAEWVKPLDSA